MPLHFDFTWIWQLFEASLDSYWLFSQGAVLNWVLWDFILFLFLMFLNSSVTERRVLRMFCLFSLIISLVLLLNFLTVWQLIMALRDSFYVLWEHWICIRERYDLVCQLNWIHYVVIMLDSIQTVDYGYILLTIKHFLETLCLIQALNLFYSALHW